MRGARRALIAVSDRIPTVPEDATGRSGMRKPFAIGATLAAALAAAVVIGVALAEQQSGSGKLAPPVPTTPPPGDFVRTIDNQYLPFEPGTTFHYQGTKDGEPSEDTMSVTHKTKTIVGVQTVVVLDQSTVSGEPEEKTLDWYAQDKRGNVWYFGEDSFDFVNGKWVRNDGSWEAGVDAAKPGIVMEADPQVGDTYRQEYYDGHAEDLARILSTNESVSVAYGSFQQALETKEWTPLERAVVEHKYYARGVGEVKSVMVKGGSEEMELVSVTRGG
jgi:hypothetical protein